MTSHAEFEKRVQDNYQAALRLDVERGYSIECHRCTRGDFTEDYDDDPAYTQQEFYARGWRMDADGYQTCRQCSPTDSKGGKQ